MPNENKQKDENEITAATGSKVYEVGYLLIPGIAEEDVPARHGDMKDLITSTFKGSIIADEMPKYITLAYPMSKVTSNVRHKFETAYFGWVKFTMGATELSELKKHLDLDPNIIRFLILKTVKENTIATKRFMRGETYRRPPTIKKHTETPEVVVPMDKEEVDKEIDALIAQ